MHGLLAVVASAVAATILALVLSSSGSAQQPGERTLTFTERNNLATFKLVDNPPRNREGVSESRFRLSLGDMFVFASPLFDAANEHMLVGGVKQRRREDEHVTERKPKAALRDAFAVPRRVVDQLERREVVALGERECALAGLLSRPAGREDKGEDRRRDCRSDDRE